MQVASSAIKLIIRSNIQQKTGQVTDNLILLNNENNQQYSEI